MAITNDSQAAQETAEKYSNPSNIVGLEVRDETGTLSNLRRNPETGDLYDPGPMPTDESSDKPSSEPVKETSAAVTQNGKPMTFDHRVKLIVPDSYVQSGMISAGPNDELTLARGIVFPYTPQITQEYKANYNTVNTVHSNYTQYFFKNSAPGEISLTAKFTVQNQTEAGIYIAVVHLLRSLIKMKYGSEANAGSPPPICRLKAYGTYMLDKVPVAVSGFRLELPDNVDYISTDVNSRYGMTSVPTLATFQITLIPLYSRAEMQRGTVAGWLSSTEDQRAQGYL